MKEFLIGICTFTRLTNSVINPLSVSSCLTSTQASISHVREAIFNRFMTFCGKNKINSCFQSKMKIERIFTCSMRSNCSSAWAFSLFVVIKTQIGATLIFSSFVFCDKKTFVLEFDLNGTLESTWSCWKRILGPFCW